jgi:hypothetical protein
VCQKTQEASVLRAALERISIVTGFVVVLMSSGGVAYAKNCTPFGCTPTQGNPIDELLGMVVVCGLVAMLLFGVARRYVK